MGDDYIEAGCTLKVNIGCCQACCQKLKDLLNKTDGVQKFFVDEENSRVAVKGRLNIKQLIKNIEKKLKKKVDVMDNINMRPPVDDSNVEVVCVFKVNIGCCQACPQKLRKLLLKTDGVRTFDIDEENSRVSIKGRVDLKQLINNIEKALKKRVEVIDEKNVTAGAGVRAAADDTVDRKSSDNCSGLHLLTSSSAPPFGYPIPRMMPHASYGGRWPLPPRPFDCYGPFSA